MKINFKITKKAIAEYTERHRNTIKDSLNAARIDIKDMYSVLDWILFEGLSDSQRYRYLKRHIVRQRGMRCEVCGKTQDLQFHHIKPRGERPDLMCEMSNIKILCLDCHATAHEILAKQSKGSFNMIRKSTMCSNPSIETLERLKELRQKSIDT